MATSGAKRSTGKVYLIGAGPGDPELLTIKAAEAIGASDVIAYDHLVNPEVLVHSRPHAELIYVGKRPGGTSISQSQIDSLMIDRALRGLVVARLKGGDPFVFGRGGEEAEALVEAGVEWEVIPGVSSGIAAAAYAGIPLTHRNYSSSVTFVTGHNATTSGRQLIDWSYFAHPGGTLVIFMCAETIPCIARQLVAAGRARATPIAIIRWATYQHQEVYSGSLEDLIEADEIGAINIEPPVIAIVGEVASLAARLNWFLDSNRFELRAFSVPQVAASETADGPAGAAFERAHSRFIEVCRTDVREEKHVAGRS